MKKLALILAAAVLSTTVSSAFAGRTGDQMLLQEQQYKRISAEKRKQAQMQAMLDECMEMKKQ